MKYLDRARSKISSRSCNQRLTKTIHLIVAVGLLSVLSPQWATSQTKTDETFGFSSVVAIAKERAERGYAPGRTYANTALAELDYDQYRMLRFKPQEALWRDGSLFQVQFFHPGFLFLRPIRVYEVVDGKATEISFSSNQFDIPKEIADSIATTDVEQFAGFKLSFPLHQATVHDDLAVFLGASYFRLVGRGDQFGLSARGLALNTAAPEGEEFPHFSEFWLVKPEPRSSVLSVYALLESESVVGAYHFVVRPGASTVVDVTTELFFRDNSKKLGIAPLTTMFLRSEGSRRGIDDFRPEIHDSDGLLIHTGAAGEQLFRPLVNPRSGVRISRFIDTNPRGFGLIQRDRAHENYLDLETYFELRPNYWIVPKGDWGRGSVELVEISSDFETNDNIVAYWVPDTVGEKQLKLEYEIHAGRIEPSTAGATLVRAISKPVQTSGEQGAEQADVRRFIVDFSGPEISALHADQPVHADLTMANGSFSELTVVKNRSNGQWRATFIGTRPLGTAVDMRLNLSLYGRSISEVWLQLWDDGM